MSGKPNSKWHETMLKKLKTEEAISEWQKKNGHKGGSVTGLIKGFAAMPAEKRQEAGRLGGSRSKRVKRTKL